jgi:hypothetical protein
VNRIRSNCMRLKTLPALFFFASTLIVAAPTERWRIDSLSLVIDSERIAR